VNSYFPSFLHKRKHQKYLAVLGALLAAAAYIYLMLGARVPVNQHPAHPPLRPIPYPPSHAPKITVVLMNYARPRMIQSSSLLPTLLAHPSVHQVLLCHANSRTAFVYNHSKVRNIDAVAMNDEWGLALRFYYCSTAASNEWVLHVDDDMELDDSAINDLIGHMILNPHRIVGHFARQYNYWKVPHRHGYDFATTLSGPVEVVLTKLLILEREVCSQFLQWAYLVDDLVASSVPHWNGEDIMINLVANHYYKVPLYGPYNNYAIPQLNVWEADNKFKDDDTGAHDLSANMDRHYHVFHGIEGWTDYWRAWWRSLQHYAYRGRLWATAKHRLSLLASATSPSTQF
jgi:Glycosyl transferase family 64 domain